MLEFKNLTKRYQNRIILNKINASYPSKGMFGIYGESGSGKSTLLNIISLLDKDYSGEVKINGLNIKNNNINISRTLGIIYQHFNLLPDLTSYENVKLANLLIGIDDNKIVESVLEKVNLNKKLWHKKIMNLSGGEKERVAIARAIVNNPSIIIADEPTGALDSYNSVITFELLKKISKTSLVLVVSHNLDLLFKYCDSVEEIHNLTLKSTDKYFRKTQLLNEDKSDNILIKNHLLNNKFKYILISLSECLSLLFSIISLSFLFFASESKDKLTTNFLDKDIFSVSKIESKKSTNSIFTFQELSRPSIGEIESLKNVLPDFSYYYDLSQIFKSNINIEIDTNIVKGIVFVPSFFKTNSFNEVVINEACFNLLNTMTFSYDFSNNLYFFENFESYTLKCDFEVIDIVKEVELLNTPRIYYNYDYAKKLLQNTYTQSNKSIYEIIAKAKSNDSISNYQMLIKIKDKAKIQDVYKIIQKGINGFDLSSNAYLIDQSFLEIKNSVELFITLFSIILNISYVAILLFICISIIIDGQKEMAILVSLGKNRKSYLKIYLKEMLLTSLLAMTFSFISASVFKAFANKLIKKYLLNSLTFNIFFPFFISAFISLIIIFIVMTITYKMYEKADLITMLRDE